MSKVMTRDEYEALPKEYREWRYTSGALAAVPYALYMGERGATVWGPVVLAERKR